MDIQSLAVGSLFGILTGAVGTWISNQSRLYRINAELKHDNIVLQAQVSAMKEEILDFKKRESERVNREHFERDHCRDEQQVSILKILDRHDGKRLGDIAKQFELSENATIFHLQSLSNDGFVSSRDYEEDPEMQTTLYKPSNSTWIIQQPGLAYLAKNKLLV